MTRVSRDGLADASLGDTVSLAPAADEASLPPTLDARRVVWPLSPFPGLPLSEAAVGAVTEVALVSAASGAVVPLPLTADGSPGMQFRMAIGE